MKDIVVVGSGASAVNAAWPLVKAGLDVLMVDVGRKDDVYTPLIPDKSFEEIRRTDPEQYRYFLGDDFQGIPFGDVRVGAQLTPPRQHLHSGVTREILTSGGFQAMLCGALGGLAAGWGAVTPPFSDEDMRGWPIGRSDLEPHYRNVAERVGIAGRSGDDLEPCLGQADYLLPGARPDSNAIWLMKHYRRHRQWFHRQGFRAGVPWIAMATRPFRGRRGLKYYDMEFWADKDQAVYRPVYTLEELKQHANFEYRPGSMVHRFRELDSGGVEVEVRDAETGQAFHIEAGRLVLAAGALGSALIVARSLATKEQHFPVLSNPYTYVPVLVPSFGRRIRDRRHSLTQILMYFQPDADKAAIQAQMYSYRSLLTFKLAKESPLPMRESIQIMQAIQSHFAILGIHHEDRPASGKFLATHFEDAEKGWRSWQIKYARESEEERCRRNLEKRLLRVTRRMGWWPIKRIDPGDGASIHYGGTLPMTTGDAPFHTRPDGRLNGTRNIYIADGSVFPHLPAKGLTFSAMAFADRVGTIVSRATRA